MQERKNLVISTAALGGYQLPTIKNFVLSFREHNQTDHMVIVVDLETKFAFADFAREHNIELIAYNSFKFVDTLINNSRYFAILDYLVNVGVDRFKNILISDVRDVVFQSNPFDNLPSEFMYFASEDSGVPLGEEVYNSQWIINTYGGEMFEKMKHDTVICSGTTIGSNQLIFEYLMAMYQQYVLIKQNRYDLFPSVILDQGITNFLVRTVFCKNPLVEIKSSGDLIGTLALSFTIPQSRDSVWLDKGKVVVNGKVPSIVHQYDRSPILETYFNNKYSNSLQLK